MSQFNFFLSVVVVFHNKTNYISETLTKISALLSTLVTNYELIIIDNGSNDNSLGVLAELTSENGLPNLQVYALTKEVNIDAASWVGIENSLGDYVVVLDPFNNDIEFLPTMLEEVTKGADIVFAENLLKPKRSIAYRVCFFLYGLFYKWFNDIHLAKETSLYKIISKKVINFILQHRVPLVTYRHLLVTSGFKTVHLTYRMVLKNNNARKLVASIEQGIKLLVSTSRAPLRLVTIFSLFGAISNLIYSVYVIVILLLKQHVAEGWVTLSLQLSGMFFLISMVLLVLGEYILHMLTLTNREPSYHVAQEFTSMIMTKSQRLNIEEQLSNVQLILAAEEV